MAVENEISDILSAVTVLMLLINLVITLINNIRLGGIHDNTNGLKDELVREVRKASYAKGKKSRGK